MKMRKIMAAGIAATLAVASLASVASAEIVREFDMKYSTGVWVFDASVSGEKSEQLGDNFKFVTPKTNQKPDTYAVEKVYDNADKDAAGGAKGDKAKGDTNNDKTVDYQDFDAFIPLKVSSFNNAIPLSAMGDLTITVEGRKYDNGNLVQRTQTLKLIKVSKITSDDDSIVDANYVLPIYAGTSPKDAFLPEEFSAVDSISVKTGSLKSIVVDGLGEALYTEIYKLRNGIDTADGKPKDVNLQVNTVPMAQGDGWKWRGYNVQAKDTANWWEGDGWTEAWCGAVNTDGYLNTTDASLVVELAAKDPFGADMCYQVNGTVWDLGGNLTLNGTAVKYEAVVPEGNDKKLGANLINEINILLKGKITAKWKAKGAAGVIVDNKAWMPVTLKNGRNYDADPKIYRDEVRLLSQTGDENSANIWSEGNFDYAHQTYKVDTDYNYNKGTLPQGFAGLASQVADFFNHHTNGTITLQFAAGTQGGTGLNWLNGGIPSTEVGLRNFLEAAQPKDFALFLNYNTTTGSLQSDAILDPYAGTVTFDISATLEALGGQTIGTVHDVYYALAKGATQDSDKVWGLEVDKVILAYNEEAAADAATDETDADTDVKEEVKEEPKADDKADEIEIPDDTEEPDDEDNTVVIEPTDDTQTVIDNTASDNTVVVNPGNNTASAAADENPHTGVALAVVPAALAAAAMIISKKRK